MAQNAATAPYLISFDVCDPSTPCLPLNQTIYVLQSSDGVAWQPLPGFTPFPGSVPAVVRRGAELYLVEQDGHDLSGRASLSAMKLLRYHMDTGIWDAPVLINLTDAANPGPYIDTDLALDPAGNIVLVYDTDFGACAAASCAQHIRIATEVPNSDGGSFIAQANDAVTIQVAEGGGAFDPYAFFDGTQYILYVPTNNGPLPQISQFAQISLYTSPTIGGPYALSTALPDGTLISVGGQASGFFNPARRQYWDYVNDASSIDQAILTSLSQQFMLLTPQPAPCPIGCPPALCAAQQCPVGPVKATPVITSGGLGLPANFLIGHPKFAKNWNGTVLPAGAVLPLSRSVGVGETATAFVTLINTDSVTAADCFIAPLTSVPATFSFQTTDPATNAVTGTLNTPVAVPGHGMQSFVIAFTPTSAFAPTDVQLQIGCASTSTASPIPGVNTLLLSGSSTPAPDIVALAATLNKDGIVHVPGATGTGVFAVATVNVGVGGMITVSADTGGASPPVSIQLCETDPVSGQCMGTPTATVTTQIDAGATPTFGIFVTGSGVVPVDPANDRIFVRFNQGNVTRGATSVAAETDQAISASVSGTASSR